MGVDCEKMCKEIGAYPNCQCPGFEGEPASSDDTRACIEKYCQDPETPCPNDAFVTCVDENTKVSALQWPAVMKKVDNGLESLLQTMRMMKAYGSSKACASSKELGTKAFIQAKAATWGVDCRACARKLVHIQIASAQALRVNQPHRMMSVLAWTNIARIHQAHAQMMLLSLA